MMVDVMILSHWKCYPRSRGTLDALTSHFQEDLPPFHLRLDENYEKERAFLIVVIKLAVVIECIFPLMIVVLRRWTYYVHNKRGDVTLWVRLDKEGPRP